MDKVFGFMTWGELVLALVLLGLGGLLYFGPAARRRRREEETTRRMDELHLLGRGALEWVERGLEQVEQAASRVIARELPAVLAAIPLGAKPPCGCGGHKPKPDAPDLSARWYRDAHQLAAAGGIVRLGAPPAGGADVLMMTEAELTRRTETARRERDQAPG